MTKAELITAVNQAAADQDIELTKKATRALVDIVFETVCQTIGDENRFYFPALGTFKVAHRKARQGRHPQTGATIEIAASNTVSFKPSPALKARIN